MAQPKRPLRIVIGYAPGGSTDIVGRYLVDKLSTKLERQVFIENRPGAGGTIGAETVAKAAPDGDTLLMGGLAELSISPGVRSDLRYDPVKDFAPITLVFRVPYALVVHPSVPARTLQEFFAYAKSNGRQLSFASYGNYNSNHLFCELLKQTVGFDSAHIPYKGSGSFLSDLLAGRVQWTLDTPTAVQEHLASGGLIALASATEQRVPMIPKVPTFSESGMPGFIAGTWIGLLAPAATPHALIEQLQRETVSLLNSPEFTEFATKRGMQFAPSTPDAFGGLIQGDLAKWKEVAKKIKVSPP